MRSIDFLPHLMMATNCTGTLTWKKQSIAFAVNVSTTGWVGFGLSPNGQMPQSDVVIGWVKDDGATTFHVSY